MQITSGFLSKLLNGSQIDSINTESVASLIHKKLENSVVAVSVSAGAAKTE